MFDKKLKKRFLNTHKFSNYYNKQFILLLRKAFYPHEYMAYWEKLNEASLPEKEDFYIDLNVEDITDADYAYIKRVSKRFKKKKLGEDHDLHVQINTLLLAGVLENFREISFEIYELDPAKYFSSTGLASQVALEKTNIKLDYSTDIGV